MARATGYSLLFATTGVGNPRLGTTNVSVTESQAVVDVTGADSTSASNQVIAGGVKRYSFNVTEHYDSASALGQPLATGELTGVNLVVSGGQTGTIYTSAGGGVIGESTMTASIEDSITLSFSGVFSTNPTIT